MRLFVDNLTNVDFSYLHPTRGLVGETWLASIELEGELDDQGMICDFGIVKKRVRQWLDEEIDHRLVIPEQNPNLNYEKTPDSYHLSWSFGEQRLNSQAPHQAITLIPVDSICAEAVANWCTEQLMQLLPNTVAAIHLRLEPESLTHFYHYSHGLKKHNGNCQRIAHGHRSTIAIYQNGQRSTELEQKWCADWQDIYIGTIEDLIKTEHGQHYFAYHSQQGQFTLDIPEQCCHLMPTDSTVENIAKHIVEQLQLQYPKTHFKVRAFEGAGKGAVAESL